MRATRRTLLAILASAVVTCLMLGEDEKAHGAAYPPFIVNDTGDLPDDPAPTPDGLCKTVAGKCTLRAAIQEATKLGAGNTYTISFAGIGSPGNIPTISPGSALPVVPFSGTIDGTTSDAGRVEINGASAEANASGLFLLGSGMTVKGLVINRFGASGITIVGANNTVTDTRLGLNKPGTSFYNTTPAGILIIGAGLNTIGPGNYFAGATSAEIDINSSDGNTIIGNRIGTNTSGAANTGPTGVLVRGDADNNVIGSTNSADRNYIGGNTIAGVEIKDNTSSDNSIIGNFFANTLPVGGFPNNGTNVWLHGGTSFNLVGGTQAGSRNLISLAGSDGILIEDATTHDNTVQGNYIGTEGTGTQDLGNTGAGIRIQTGAHNNKIGGNALDSRNVIVNNGIGIAVDGDANIVQGNYVGVSTNGTTSFPNGDYGVMVQGGDGNQVGGTQSGAGNVVSGHALIDIGADGDVGTLIQGNHIGTDATGETALTDGINGIFVEDASGTVITGNVVSGGHRRAQVRISSAASDTVVQNNLIGTNAAGDAVVGPPSMGIEINSDTQVGGPGAGEGNTIAGQGVGIVVGFSSGSGAGSVIQGNRIGVAADGESPLPNEVGVKIDGLGADVLVGGIDEEEGNVIAFNTEDGVRVADGAAHARIDGNSIHDNGGLGIDLGDDGVTPNDAHDSDTGANGLQNFPDMTTGPNTLHVSLNTVPDIGLVITLYRNTACDASGHGEGETYVGLVGGMIGSGPSGHYETDMAVDPGLYTTIARNDDNGDTSEFSECVQVTGETPAPTPTDTGAATPTPTGSAPTPTPTGGTPTPSATPAAGPLAGDLNCDGFVDEADVLGPLAFAGDVAFDQDPPCSSVGDGDPLFGDVNCDGVVDVFDALAFLLFLEDLPYDQDLPCAAIGSPLT